MLPDDSAIDKSIFADLYIGFSDLNSFPLFLLFDMQFIKF